MVKADLIGHTRNGIEYIKGAKKVIFENGIVMTVDEFNNAEKLGTLGNLILEYRFHPEHCGYDYAYCKSTGVIRKKAVHQKKEISKEPVNTPDIPNDSGFKAPKQPGMKYYATANIIIMIMTVVGVMSSVMSAYHTSEAMQIMGRSAVVGWITGTVMILFSATAFTAARFFLNEKSIAKMFGILFGVLGVIVILYSMFSTLTVNYVNYRKVADVVEMDALHGSSEMDAYNNKVNILERKLAGYDATIEKLESDAEYWKTMSWRRHDEIQTELREVRKSREETANELINVQMMVPEIAAKAKHESGNVYTFFASIFHISSDLLQFLIQAVPAMFFDVIAPFALSCVFYLSDKRKEKRYE